MGEVYKRLLKWVTALLPNQTNTAQGAVQVGKAGGDVTVIKDGAVHIGQAAGPVTNVHQLTQNFYAAVPPVLVPPRPARGRFKGHAKLEHKEVLKLMNHLTPQQRKLVLQKMDMDYGTGMVKELWPDEAVTLYTHVESVLRASVERARA